MASNLPASRAPATSGWNERARRRKADRISPGWAPGGMPRISKQSSISRGTAISANHPLHFGHHLFQGFCALGVTSLVPETLHGAEENLSPGLLCR